MERRKALIVAGFLAATVTSAVLLFGAYAANAAADRPVSTTVQAGTAAAESAANDQAYLAEMQATLAERETILAAQLALDQRKPRTQLEQGDGLAVDHGDDAVQFERARRFGRRGDGHKQGRQQDKDVTFHGRDQ